MHRRFPRPYDRSERPPDGRRKFAGSRFSNVVLRVVEGERDVRLTISGELDMADASTFARRLGALVESREGPFRIDLRQLEFIDSHGVRALLEIASTATNAGRAITIVVADGGSVRRLVDIVGLGQVIEIVPG